ncbi:MAG: mechanosensitive ion channel [Deinococcales bacterium]
MILLIAWLSVRIVVFIINQQLHLSKEKLRTNPHLRYGLLLLKNVIRVVIWSLAAVVFLNTLGLNVAAIIAGLGIGGLAVAFAAQSTIANFISGIIIFIEQPFKIGDNQSKQCQHCAGRGYHLALCALKTDKQISISIPNHQVTDSQVLNYTPNDTLAFDEISFYVPSHNMNSAPCD